MSTDVRPIMTEDRGFFEALFDLSFESFITMRLVRLIYVLGIIGSTILALWMLAAAFEVGPGAVVLMLVVAPLTFLVGVTVTRLYLELAIVVFRIEEHASEAMRRLERSSSPAGPETAEPETPGTG